MVKWTSKIWNGEKGIQFDCSETRSNEATMIHIFFGMMIGAMAAEVIPKYLNACGMDGTMVLKNEIQEVLSELGITVSVDEAKMKEFCKNFRADDGTPI